MRKVICIVSVLILLSCSKEETTQISGKWFTYAESGDYMELWIGQDKAMSYLSGIDQFLLYDLKRNGNHLNFSLIESQVVDKHEFSLEVTKSSEELLQATFRSENKTAPKKTYFLLDKETPNLKGTLAENRDLMEEMFARLESGSHAGHGH